jgi:hypothetical protein
MNRLKRKQIRLGVFLILFFLVAGCGEPKVTGPETGPAFPENRYLKADGIGRTQIDARQQAMAELSGIFESKVSSQYSSFARSSLASDQAEDFQKTIESRIHINSDIRLKGVMIGKEWQDDATGTFHALAVLDRMDAGRNWTSKVEILDAEIQAESRTLEIMNGRLSRMAALNRIIGLIMERQVWESRMRVIDYPVVDFSHLETDLGAVMSELSALKSDLQVYIEIQGKYRDRVRDILAQGLTRQGITIVNTPGLANARVTGRVDVDLLTLENPNSRFVRAQGNVQVFETHTLFAQISEKIRKGHKDQAEAVHKAVESVSMILSDRLLANLGFGEK